MLTYPKIRELLIEVLMKLKIINNKDEELIIFITDRMMERIVDLMYPSKGLEGVSKGYITLINHINK